MRRKVKNMYFVEKTFSDIILDFSLLPKEFDAENSIFFDIETSGLSPKNSPVFLIGLMFFKKHEAIFRQYFSNSVEEEIYILNAFVDDVKCFETIYHFNGLSFDIPFINKRLAYHGIKYQLNKDDSFDIFQVVKKHKEILGLESCRLKSVEEYLGIFREDDLSGKEVADSYKKYVNTKSHFLRDKILLHNEEDILNLYKILPILKIIDSKNQKTDVEILDFSINFFDDTVLFEGKCNLSSSANIIWSNENINFNWDNDSKNFKLEFAVITDILYYFFKDYKNYYYFPELDQAVHKSAAKYYRFEKKAQATKQNCYIKQSLKFIQFPIQIENPHIKTCRLCPECEDNCLVVDELKDKIDRDFILRLLEKTISLIKALH